MRCVQQGRGLSVAQTLRACSAHQARRPSPQPSRALTLDSLPAVGVRTRASLSRLCNRATVHVDAALACTLAVDRFDRWKLQHVGSQATFSPRRGGSAASTATAWATCIRSKKPEPSAVPARRARRDMSACLLVRTEVRANARKVRHVQRLVIWLCLSCSTVCCRVLYPKRGAGRGTSRFDCA